MENNMKFKIGDRVERVINSHDNMKPGDIETITYITETHINFNGKEGYNHKMKYFKLADPIKVELNYEIY